MKTPHVRSTQLAVVSEARKWIGTPYQHQASLYQVGCDCLGLVRGVWRHLYGQEPCAIPAYSVDWAERGHGETLFVAAQKYLDEISPDMAETGDVLLFRFSTRHIIKHCAILTTPHRITHAYWGKCISETALTPWWQNRIAAAFKFPD
ncbi:MAG: peptidase P60 [Robiginitomaculum sp.]|nr:MAG: peptidase P60 [Robiginitomaculum sp.]